MLNVIRLHCSMEAESVPCVWTMMLPRLPAVHRLGQRCSVFVFRGQTPPVHAACIGSTAKRLNDVSALFYVPEWSWCPPSREMLNAGSASARYHSVPFPHLSLAPMHLSGSHAPLLLGLYCLNWASARWSLDTNAGSRPLSLDLQLKLSQLNGRVH